MSSCAAQQPEIPLDLSRHLRKLAHRAPCPPRPFLILSFTADVIRGMFLFMHGLFRLFNHLAAKYVDPEGNAEAQNTSGRCTPALAMMYEQGQGVPQNYIMAHMWFNLAASRATDTATRNQAAKNCNRTAAEM
jgi:hypothetical protein